VGSIEEIFFFFSKCLNCNSVKHILLHPNDSQQLRGMQYIWRIRRVPTERSPTERGQFVSAIGSIELDMYEWVTLITVKVF
jgi:hypothetical protein